MPDGLTEKQITDYRKKFWDEAHNKACVSIPLLVESDVEEYQTDGGSYLPGVSYTSCPSTICVLFILRLIPLVTPIAVVMRGIIHALPVPFRLDEKQMRIDTTTAHTALREAFANSIIHCAYTVMGILPWIGSSIRLYCRILVRCW